MRETFIRRCPLTGGMPYGVDATTLHRAERDIYIFDRRHTADAKNGSHKLKHVPPCTVGAGESDLAVVLKRDRTAVKRDVKILASLGLVTTQPLAAKYELVATI